MPSPSLSSLLLLVAFRLLNAFVMRTFFQPDEFFQSLEPAWQIAFGSGNGAWITWEWRHQLRSSLHPLLFATVYYHVDGLARILDFLPATRAELLIAAPKAAQAVIAAVGDYYTWKLARRVYGGGNEARAALALTVLSPWQWFCSTRTLSNCLETTLTIVALYQWPWEWSLGSTVADESKTSRKAGRRKDGGNLTRIRQCLCLAALACILRPTNILVWMCLASVALLRGSWSERMTMAREVVLCGSAVLALSAVADRLFYGVWTFPPLKFLYFNLAQSLAVFYGRNDWHYYLSQGYPLLLTTALPFTLVGLYRALAVPSTSDKLQTRIRTQLASICIIMPLALSLISHKEVRFIYPLLPSLHILTAPVLVNYFLPAIYRSSRVYTPRRLTLLFLLVANIAIALYTTIYHASGTLNVLGYLRDQHQAHSQPPSSPGISAGFLMPCHSTPWRSHLVHPNINAWALSCEPPVGLSEREKASYVDEADQFYENPGNFLRQNMEGGIRHIPRKSTYLSPRPKNQEPTTHPWPDYLIFFAHLEPTLNTLLRASSYTECWRTFNTAWHDDWRRRGDIIVWCLDPKEQRTWRSENRKRAIDSRSSGLDDIIDKLKREISSSRGRKSPFQRWMADLDLSGQFQFQWPWERRRGSVSAWVSDLTGRLTSWRPSGLGSGGKRKNKLKMEERDLWS